MKKTLTDDEFLDTLMELVLAEGIRNLTIGEIAAGLRCSRRRLYEIAQTKEEIFCAMVDRFFRGVLDKGEALASKKRDLPAAIAAYLDEGVKAAARISVGFLTDVDESEVARACFDHYQQTRTLRLAQLVDEGVHTGVFIPCHGRVVSEVILGAALRLRRPGFLAEAGLTIEEAFQEFYRLLLSGLLTQASKGAPDSDGLVLANSPGRAAPARRGKRAKASDTDLDKKLLAAWNRD
jgi:AcrR family transcriptional regulator